MVLSAAIRKLGSLWGLVCAVLLMGTYAHAETYQVGQEVSVPLLELLPTQFSIGRREVEERARTLRLRTWFWSMERELGSKRKRAVVGPEGKLYLIDGHHLAAAALLAGVEKFPVEIVADFSSLGQDAFWEELKQRNWVYFKDENGRLRDPSELPKRLADLQDDPYRSLAWMVQNHKGFAKDDTPFLEFAWADFFRERLPFDPTKASEWRRVRRAAMGLALSEEASHLRGYCGPKYANLTAKKKK